MSFGSGFAGGLGSGTSNAMNMLLLKKMLTQGQGGAQPMPVDPMLQQPMQPGTLDEPMIAQQYQNPQQPNMIDGLKQKIMAFLMGGGQ